MKTVMYLISVYFDEKTNNRIQRFMDMIASKTGNTFMTDNHVPPHMTVSSVEARSADVLVPEVEELEKCLIRGKVRFVSVGSIFPYVLYVTPVLNEYLQDLSRQIYKAVSTVPETTVSRYYQPMSWLPHVTVGKTLTKEQMQMAFSVMQDNFSVFEGQVVSLGLAKPNPHRDVLRFDLKG